MVPDAGLRRQLVRSCRLVCFPSPCQLVTRLRWADSGFVV